MLKKTIMGLRPPLFIYELILALTIALIPGFSDTCQSADLTNSLPLSSPPTKDSTSASPDTPKPILQGGVEHSEQLSSLDESLKPGSVFDESVLSKPNATANNDWFWIPDWYAGKRHTEDILIVFRHDYVTGLSTTPMQRQQERQDSVSGHQRDRNGDIWEFKNAPFIQHVESGLELAVLYIKSMEPISISRSQVVLRYEVVSISYSRKGHIILSVVQQEQINNLTPVQPGLIRGDVSVKAFGWDGQPQRSEQSVVFSQIIEPFHRIDTLDGKDLRGLFKDFLISQHLENLVPDDLKN